MLCMSSPGPHLAPSLQRTLPAADYRRISVLDSHTAGEPTRLVLAGGPELHGATVADQLMDLRTRHPGFRPAIIREPRGSEVVVGALLCRPARPESAAGVIFFNDVGYLGMCGHGTIGLVASLAHLGRIAVGEHGIETPVGVVRATLHADGSVTVANVPSYRVAASVAIDVPELGTVSGDIAWGGNWFYLLHTPAPCALELANVAELTRLATAVREALRAAGRTGPGGETIDHIEWFSAAHDRRNHSRNFVLCPGAAYDRSPCGTGTSAKLACLAAGGRLQPGETWRQEGILGTVFSARYRAGPEPGCILPEITGSAWMTGESTLLFSDSDPFAEGIPAI